MQNLASEIPVLLVEDEVIIAMDIESIAEAAGLRVAAHALRGSEALALFEAHRPRLCLVDLHLLDGPVGLECGRRLAGCGATVVFMTANQAAVPADFANAIGLIAKPFTDASLLAAFQYLGAFLRGETEDEPAPGALVLAPDSRRGGQSPPQTDAVFA